MSINYDLFDSLKGELEAEGLSKIEIAGELVYALRNGLEYLVKISGSEANSDITYLSRIGVKRIVCPMIESPFSMYKYMDAVSDKGFDHLGVTIETGVAVNNIESILDAGTQITEVTVGRSDLSSSIGMKGLVEDKKVLDMVEKVAVAAKNRGLKFGMGGAVSNKTKDILAQKQDLTSLLDFVETRKAIIPIKNFLNNNALSHAINLELDLLRTREKSLVRTIDQVSGRIQSIKDRI